MLFVDESKYATFGVLVSKSWVVAVVGVYVDPESREYLCDYRTVEFVVGGVISRGGYDRAVT